MLSKWVTCFANHEGLYKPQSVETSSHRNSSLSTIAAPTCCPHFWCGVTLPLLKDPLPMGRPGTIFPSIQSWTLLLWFVALSLSSSICPLRFFRNTSFSDGSQLPMLESSFIPDFNRLGAPGLESAPLSWDAHSLWRYHWGPRLWTLSHNQWAPNVHLSLNFSPESRHSTAEAPI